MEVNKIERIQTRMEMGLYNKNNEYVVNIKKDKKVLFKDILKNEMSKGDEK